MGVYLVYCLSEPQLHARELWRAADRSCHQLAVSFILVARKGLMGMTMALESSESESFATSRCVRSALAARLSFETLVGLSIIAPSQREAAYFKPGDSSLSTHIKPCASL